MICEARKRSFMTLGPGLARCQNNATVKIFPKTRAEKKDPPMPLCNECFEAFHKVNPDYKFEHIEDVK